MRNRRLVSDRDAVLIRELADAIVDAPITGVGPRVSYHSLLANLGEAVGASRVTVHRLEPRDDRWELEFHSYWSAYPGADQECERFDDLVRRRRIAYTFDPGIPAPPQRNRVMSRSEIERGFRPGPLSLDRLAEAVGVGSGFRDQLRALICDGPRLLAFVAVFRDVPFDERDRAVLAAFVPALRRAHLAERAERELALMRSGMQAALDLLGEPAFLVDGRGRVRLASRSGDEWLTRTPDAKRLLLDVARGDRKHGTARSLDGQAGSVVVVRGSTERNPSSRLGRAQEQWDLTRRQVDVLAYVVDGRSNKDIARALHCTEGNVELHVTNLLRRSRASNRAELVSKYWAL